jgi:hypothetical protein
MSSSGNTRSNLFAAEFGDDVLVVVTTRTSADGYRLFRT